MNKEVEGSDYYWDYPKVFGIKIRGWVGKKTGNKVWYSTYNQTSIPPQTHHSNTPSLSNSSRKKYKIKCEE